MKQENIKKEIAGFLDSMSAFGIKIDIRNKTNLIAYVLGLLKTYIGSFSLLQMSDILKHSYDRLQHLSTHSNIKEKRLNIARLLWRLSFRLKN